MPKHPHISEHRVEEWLRQYAILNNSDHLTFKICQEKRKAIKEAIINDIISEDRNYLIGEISNYSKTTQQESIKANDIINLINNTK